MTSDDYQWVFDGIKNIDDIRPECFLLKKDQRGKYMHSYRLQPIQTGYFKSKIKSKLVDTQTKFDNKEIKIRNFYREETDDMVVNILDATKYDFIKRTIEDIFQTASANKIDKLNSMEKVNFSAVLFKIPNGKSIIALDSVSIFNEAFKRIGLIVTYDEDGMKKLEKSKSVIAFELGLPCIYFEESQKIVVFDRSKTESILNLKEYYKKKAKTTFQKLVDEEIIDLDSKIFEKETNNITTARRINTMIEEDVFTTDITIYKKYESYFKKHPEIDDEMTKLTIKDDKVMLHSKQHFQSFLHLTGYNLDQSVIDPDKIFIAYQKRRVKTKSIITKN